MITDTTPKKVARKPLILVVDDFVQNIQVLGQNLESAGYDIAIANSGEDAIETLSHIKPDLILLDIMMPGISGYEVAKTLQKNTATAQIPIIFLTAKSEPDDIVEGFESGGVDYIYKPFNTPELLARVRTHIELKRAREELKELNANKDKLISIIAHDLRNALASIVSLSHLASEGIGTGDRATLKADISLLYNTASELYSVMENLLDWAAVQQGMFRMFPSSVNIYDTLQAIVNLYEKPILEKSLQVNLNLDTSSSIEVDINAFNIIMRNFINNAIKYSYKDGVINIDLIPHEDSVEMCIEDNGIGMDKKTLNELFKFFGNSVPGTSQEKGSGIGLSLSKKLLDLCYGEVTVESEPCKGTTFTIKFLRRSVD